MISLLAGATFENCLLWGGTLILPFQVWLLFPSKSYKIAKNWVREAGSGFHPDWLRYRTLKRFLTPEHIAMNAVDLPEFTKEDLESLNRLFDKLAKPPAEFIVPAIGQRFDETDQIDLNRLTDSSTRYVEELVQSGVRWGATILKPAQVKACTADCLAVQQLLNGTTLPSRIISLLQNCFDKSPMLVPDFRLDASLLQGLVQMTLSETETEALFLALCNAHPEAAYVRVTPAEGEVFNGNTMATSGGEIAGMNCRVDKVRHSGLTRKDDPEWRIKALVKIANTGLPR